MSENFHWRSCHKWISTVRWAASAVHTRTFKRETTQTSYFTMMRIVLKYNESWIMFSVDCLWSNGSLFNATNNQGVDIYSKIVGLLLNVIWLFDDFIKQGY